MDGAAERRAVLNVIESKMMVSEVSRPFDLESFEIEEWFEQGKADVENALRAKREDSCDQYVHYFKDLLDAYG